MSDITFNDKLFDVQLEGKVIAEVKLRFLPIKPLMTHKERMACDRIAVRLDQLAKQAELQLEEQINIELSKLEGATHE